MRIIRLSVLILLGAVTLTDKAYAQNSVTLAWDANTDPVAGYIVYRGTSPSQYSVSVDVGNVTSYTFSDLTPGQLYYFSVRAYDSQRVVSDPSTEAAGTVLGVPAVPSKQDLSGDDWSDLLWQRASDGMLQLWRLRGPVVSSIGSLNPATAGDPNWQVKGFGDFNRDGQPDLLWQHARTGTLAVWLMNGETLVDGQLLSPSSASDLSWTVVGVRDFDRDGYPDLLWRRVDGWLAIWFMTGTQLRDGVMLQPGRPDDLAWQVVAVGDLFGDGSTQILWHHADGWLAVWRMNREKLMDGALLTPSRVTDPSWSVIGLVDVNGDGRDDLIWRNSTTGQTAAWLMHGLQLSDGLGFAAAPSVPLQWRLIPH